ncbi:Gfo/Idh/MocA family oxidoreductase [Cryobacterium sp. 10S3]|nr:Gfo/Idh/MocA family oxidoreductase [Cryobacterium sp. 10S3]WPX13278.1 Gfo/Idh/MocA family oxidoreductase [Cryobacterium sp. 10S3]
MQIPLPRTPDPREAPALRWGIAAPGSIASDFAQALSTSTRQSLVAVGSRDRERARAFASAHNIPHAYGSYPELVSAVDIDAIYVASVTSEHFPIALLAIEAGKHVLVEKAMTRNAHEARVLADSARDNGVVLMEAMKTRFLPRTDVVRQLLSDGVIGDLEWVSADVGRSLMMNSRLLDPALAGGALLDLGCYAVALVLFALGRPNTVRAEGVLTASGVDRQTSIMMGEFAGHPGAQAHVFATIGADTGRRAQILGSRGRIELPDGFYGPGRVEVVLATGATATYQPDELRGRASMAYEIAHFAEVVHRGDSESPLMPVAESIAAMETMDRARCDLGVTYPGEQPCVEITREMPTSSPSA